MPEGTKVRSDSTSDSDANSNVTHHSIHEFDMFEGKSRRFGGAGDSVARASFRECAKSKMYKKAADTKDMNTSISFYRHVTFIRRKIIDSDHCGERRVTELDGKVDFTQNSAIEP